MAAKSDVQRRLNTAAVRALVALVCSVIAAPGPVLAGAIYPGADEKTPSRSEYFSWVNNTNEGATERQTLINLAFFKWLHDEYGLWLDIYAFDAGAVDGPGFYGTLTSKRFRTQFPHGFAPVVKAAAGMSTRLGLWGGPDGYGNTAAEAEARRKMMVSFCRDDNFELFKWDGVCGGLRPEKQDEVVETLKECRQYCPDLIVLNHRLELGKARPYVTTWLWEGAETYIDVHMPSAIPAPHHRAGALGRGLVPNWDRLAEDHGVCLSSCLDGWDDDLILQAFNRCLILAPEIYGNPWLLRDDEFPKLARIFNLHREYRDILVNGILLPKADYGPNAVSRGDATTRLISLRNLGWQPVKYQVRLDDAIGLASSNSDGGIELRQFHPTERILGHFARGATVEVEVPPFRACLLIASAKPMADLGVNGCDYAVVRDVTNRPVLINLYGMPGSRTSVSLSGDEAGFSHATLDGQPADQLLVGKPVSLRFKGEALKNGWHRKLADLKPCPVPEDAVALYEATCFAADNNALEVRSLQRSGATHTPEVQRARDAFFQQPVFAERKLWDRFLFDGNPDTAFAVNKNAQLICGGAFRLDLGSMVRVDKVVFKTTAKPVNLTVEVSADLKQWQGVRPDFGKDSIILSNLPSREIRFVRITPTLPEVSEIEGYYQGIRLERSGWRASNLFGPYANMPATKAWIASFRLDEIPRSAYLAIAINGVHGKEGAYAAARIGGKLFGAPDRSVSYQANVWEYPVARMSTGYTYYIPLTAAMVGQPMEVVVLKNNNDSQASSDLKPEVWLTAKAPPFESCQLVLTK